MGNLSEEDIKNRYITPALEKSGWRKEQMRMEFLIKKNEYFTDGKIIIEDKTAKRGERKKADYLSHHPQQFSDCHRKSQRSNQMWHTVSSKRLTSPSS